MWTKLRITALSHLHNAMEYESTATTELSTIYAMPWNMIAQLTQSIISFLIDGQRK